MSIRSMSKNTISKTLFKNSGYKNSVFKNNVPKKSAKESVWRNILLGGCVLAPSLLVSSMYARADAPVAPNDDSLTLKQHVIKWMLTDENFVEKAAMSSRAEIELSQLALQKSQNSKVIGFAKTMVSDHTSADAKLKAIAHTENLAIPGEQDDAHADALEKLQKLEGAQFDAVYLDTMRKDHAKAVSLFAAAAADEGLNAQLRQFAQQTLPTLRMHQEHVKALDAGGSTSSR